MVFSEPWFNQPIDRPERHTKEPLGCTSRIPLLIENGV